MKKMSNQETAVKTITINSMEDVVGYLSDSVNQVSYDVNNINLQVDDVQNQVNDMKNNVKSLETEVREFIKEMKHNVMINDAKQTIMMSQIEYNKKYRNRDDVRRRILGMLQSIDINVIKKSTMETITEETIINNPDYWLANALVALCYWYGDNKELAQFALNQALKNSDEKTSFLFCLIHLRGNRIETAIKWLKRYLSLQDPTNMDCKIILLLDALCSGIFGQEIIEVIINKIKEWELKLNNYPEYENKQILTWVEYFKSKSKDNQNNYEYIDKFVLDKEHVNKTINYLSSSINMIEEFKKTINNVDNITYNHQNKIDKLINSLIFDYEPEELQLKTEIEKSNAIINSTKEDKIVDKIEIYEKKDLYTHISNICFNENIFDVGIYTKKMAIAMLKKYIITAYKNVCNVEAATEKDLSIQLLDWVGVTKNGENEVDLKQNLSNFIQKKYQNELDTIRLFTNDMIFSVVLGIIGIVLTLLVKYPIAIPVIIIGILIYNIYKYYQNRKIKQFKQSVIDKEKKDMNILLMCTISDIVDYYFDCKEHTKTYDEFIEYLDSLDYGEYIKTYTENKRNIIIGEKI